MSQSKPLHFRLCIASLGEFELLTPRLGGECSIQLSYEDMSDFWLKIRLSAIFQASGSVAGYSITYAFWMNCSIQLSSIHSPLVASYITLTLTDSNYRVLFPIVQRRQASPFLRRVKTLRPFFEKYCKVLTNEVKDPKDFQPGDIIIFGPNDFHIGMCSDNRNSEGFPFIFHNGGQLKREDDYIKRSPITGHYRFERENIPIDVIVPWDEDEYRE